MSRLEVSVLLFDAFSNMVLSCLLEPLRVVRDQAGAEITWTIQTHGDHPVSSSSGLKITPDRVQADAPRPDLALIVGGDVFRKEIESARLRRSIGHAIRAETVIAADTGAWLLARCGLLDGREATLHWQLIEEFTETFPEVSLSTDRFARDGRYWTCGSASAALDLMLALIRERFGPAAAFDAGAMFLHDSPRQFGVSFPEQALKIRGSDKLRHVIHLMSETLENPISVPALARASHMSERSLYRLFVREMNVTPGRYHQMLRLARARELTLHSDLSLNDVALRCGYSGATTLARSFKHHHGVGLRSLKSRG